MSSFTKLFRGIVFSSLLSLLVLAFISCEDTAVKPTSDTNTIAGTITDKNDMGVPFAVVQVTADQKVKVGKILEEKVIATDTTDEDGMFSISNLPIDLSNLNLKVIHPDYQPYSINLQNFVADKDRKKLPVRLLNDSNCKGRLTITVYKKKDTTVLSEVEVRLNRDGTIIRKGKTNAQGQIVFENLCNGKYWLRLSKYNFKVIETDDGLTINGDTTINRTFMMEMLNESDTCCNSIINVLAKDNNTQQLLSGVTIKLWKNGTLLSSYTTEANGAIAFRNLCTGTYSISMLKNGYYTQEFQVTVNCNDTINNERYMIQDSCCNGKALIFVTDSAGGPMPGYELNLWKNDIQLGSVKSNDMGFYLYTGLCSGTYTVKFARTGFQPAKLTFTIECNDSLTFVQKVYPVVEDTCCNGVIKVHVLDSKTSLPLNGATVKIWKGGSLLGSQTVAEGWVSFTKLCVGTYSFDILKDGYTHQEFSVTITCNQTIELEKKLVPTNTGDSCCHGNYILYALDSLTGKGLNPASVYLYKNGTKIAAQTTGDNGRTVFVNLCPGTYSFNISKDGYNGREGSFSISCNDTLEGHFRLLAKDNSDSCCHGNYIFTAKDSATGNRLSGASVALWKNGTKLSLLTTNNDGLVRFTNLCPGTYSISLTKDGYNGTEFSFTLECNDTLTGDRRIGAKASPDTCCTAVLRVHVVDSLGTAIQNAAVYVRLNGVVKADPRTNAEGNVTVQNLCAPAKYSLLIKLDGYKQQEVSVEFGECLTQEKTVTLQKQ